MLPDHKGVKEGCAEGDCGACTVVIGELGDGRNIHYSAVDSCLFFLPMLDGKQLITVENLRSATGDLHPVQQAMVDTDGSQCGYCTPGFIMSLFSLFKNSDHPSRDEIDDALTGNLCRCTGYRPIIEAAAKACIHDSSDHFTKDEPQAIRLMQSLPRGSVHVQSDRRQYFRPVTLTEALSLKQKFPDAVVISGATDVALRVTKKHEVLNSIIDISNIAELKNISVGEVSVSIGAGVTISNALATVQKHFPALFDMLSVFGSRQIRNLATFGGNLGTASPIGDTLPVLVA
jgi:xanthine dehydrogenase small subunit